MNTIETALFYIGIEENKVFSEQPKGVKKSGKAGLSIKKTGKKLPYLLGSSYVIKGNLLISWALLPEYEKKTLIRRREKLWRPERAAELVRRTLQQAGDYGVFVPAPKLAGGRNRIEVPVELLAARLYMQRPFEYICISLPEEGGDYQTEQILELITPYLSRLRGILWAGGAKRQQEMLEDYLYGEYGLVMTQGRQREGERIPRIDLCEEGVAETLKFLDTLVKNRYNTGVN